MDHCPLHGVCSECGFEFEWSRVLNAEKYKLPWFYEHGRGVGLRRAWRTWQRMVVPWRFWRPSDGVRLDTPSNAWRLVVWLPLLIGSVWFIRSTLDVLRILVTIWFDPQYAGVRAGAAGWRWWVGAIANPYLSGLGQVAPAPGGGLRFYPYIQVPYAAQAWATCAALMPLLLLMLPHTRAMVRVRATHIWRAAVYSTGLVVFLAIDAFFWNLVDLLPATLRASWFGWTWGWNPIVLVLQGVATLLGIAWFALWWWVVLVRVFALPNGRWVWTLLMVACVLAAVAVASLDDNFAMLLFGW